MPIKYKIDILAALKEKGYSTYRLRKEKLIGEATIQQLRRELRPADKPTASEQDPKVRIRALHDLIHLRFAHTDQRRSVFHAERYFFICVHFRSSFLPSSSQAHIPVFSSSAAT